MVTLDGAPLAGATIAYAGPLNGSVQTAADGTYMFGGIEGTYRITARREGYLDSAAVDVSGPPDAVGGGPVL